MKKRPAGPTRRALADALRTELIDLWCDLENDYRYSRSTPAELSIGCLNRIERIHAITRLVGPVGPENVSMSFLLTGMYEQVHAEIGIRAVVPEEILEECRIYVAEQKVRWQ